MESRFRFFSWLTCWMGYTLENELPEIAALEDDCPFQLGWCLGLHMNSTREVRFFVWKIWTENNTFSLGSFQQLSCSFVSMDHLKLKAGTFKEKLTLWKRANIYQTLSKPSFCCFHVQKRDELTFLTKFSPFKRGERSSDVKPTSTVKQVYIFQHDDSSRSRCHLERNGFSWTGPTSSVFMRNLLWVKHNYWRQNHMPWRTQPIEDARPTYIEGRQEKETTQFIGTNLFPYDPCMVYLPTFTMFYH